MKNQKRLLAQNLFFRTGLSKTEIAEILNVSRRTIYLWSRRGDWERLRLSAQHLPSIVTEECYYILAHLTRHLLSEAREGIPATFREAETMHKIALTINKIRNRSTLNESMEFFTHFLQGLKSKDPALAERVLPHVEQHITSRRDVYIGDFLPPGYNEQGYIPKKPLDVAERNLDAETFKELQQNTPAG